MWIQIPDGPQGNVGGGNVNSITDTIKALKAFRKMSTSEEEAKKKKEPPKSKYPTFSFGMMLCLMMGFGPIVGFITTNAYLALAKATLEHLVTVLK